MWRVLGFWCICSLQPEGRKPQKGIREMRRNAARYNRCFAGTANNDVTGWMLSGVQNGVGDEVRLIHRGQWSWLHAKLRAGLIEEGGIDACWQHIRDADRYALMTQFQAKGIKEADHAMLRRGVGALEWHG